VAKNGDDWRSAKLEIRRQKHKDLNYSFYSCFVVLAPSTNGHTYLKLCFFELVLSVARSLCLARGRHLIIGDETCGMKVNARRKLAKHQSSSTPSSHSTRAAVRRCRSQFAAGCDADCSPDLRTELSDGRAARFLRTLSLIWRVNGMQNVDFLGWITPCKIWISAVRFPQLTRLSVNQIV